MDIFDTIREQLIKNLLSWPNEFIEEMCCKGGNGSVSHPRHQGSELGNVPDEEVDSWGVAYTNFYLKR